MRIHIQTTWNEIIYYRRANLSHLLFEQFERTLLFHLLLQYLKYRNISAHSFRNSFTFISNELINSELHIADMVKSKVLPVRPQCRDSFHTKIPHSKCEWQKSGATWLGLDFRIDGSQKGFAWIVPHATVRMYAEAKCHRRKYDSCKFTTTE